MNDGLDKLNRDLEVLEAMAAEMDDYLRSDVLFWPLQGADLPRLTLGGYLMRQHRLAALNSLLNEDGKSRFVAAMEVYKQALAEKIVRFESKAQEELEVRLRYWERFLHDLGQETSSPAFYATSVETRAMIAALITQLLVAPYQLPPQMLERVTTMDNYLRSRFQTGEFVWPEEWQPAYAKDRYWWLYGRPG